MSQLQPSKLPLRWRLSLWYTLTFSIILLFFAGFLYWQLRLNLLNQLDSSLQLVASQMGVYSHDEQLRFQETAVSIDPAAAPNNNFIIYLAADDGTVWDTAGSDNQLPLFWPHQAGLNVLAFGDDQWRVFSQQVSAGGVDGWVQIIADMDPINDTLDRLLALMLIGGPLALALAGAGGFFIAGRALRPIDRMTQTAQTITANDLSQRIAYTGADDEVGRLAQTFDTMLDRLQTAFERERRFTGDAAHELRTPLTALKGRIGVTLSRPRQPEAYTDTLEDMEQQVDRLIRLSNDLLFIARLDQGQFRARFEPIVLADFLGAMVEQIRPLAIAKSITITTENTDSDLIIHGDFDLLIRLFLNLLDNAVKYTGENGRVSIHTHQAATFIHIAIRDSGIGIAAEHLPHLFERFYRVEDHRTRQRGNEQSGAGLGLAIAHEIAKTHGGGLTVQSEWGMGTLFTVQLPKNADVTATDAH